MKLFNLNRQTVISAMEGLIQADSKAWWIEIITTEPPCLYYFGPFQNPVKAVLNCFGYIADLSGERAEGITVTVKRCNPEILTICNMEEG